MGRVKRIFSCTERDLSRIYHRCGSSAIAGVGSCLRVLDGTADGRGRGAARGGGELIVLLVVRAIGGKKHRQRKSHSQPRRKRHRAIGVGQRSVGRSAADLKSTVAKNAGGLPDISGTGGSGPRDGLGTEGPLKSKEKAPRSPRGPRRLDRPPPCLPSAGLADAIVHHEGWSYS